MSVSPYSGIALSRSAWHFLLGKSVSAPLTIAILFLLVRLLSVEEYGVYVTLVAGMELTLVLASIGIPWIAARYLPELRVHSSGQALGKLVRQLIQWFGLSLITAALLLGFAIPYLLAHMDLAQFTDVARVYLVVLVAEGAGRFLRDYVLSPLLQQRAAQLSLVTRNLVLLVLLGMMVLQDKAQLTHVVVAEAVASSFAALLGMYELLRYLRMHRDLPGRQDWREPHWKEMWRVARHMYFSHLISLVYSSDVLILLVQRYLGIEATALFGFLLRIYVQINHYLPATLLFSLVRPKLVASYVGAGGMRELTQNANLAGKLNLFALMPIIIIVALTGNELLDLLSGGKFLNAGNYFALLLMALIPYSQRQILETVAVASDMSHLCFLGGLLGTFALPLAYWLLEAGFGLWSAIVALIAGEMIFNTKLVATLSRSTPYRPDTAGFVKLALAATATFVIVQTLDLMEPSRSRLIVMAWFACALYLFASYFIKPFCMEERDRLNRLLKRKLFVW